MGYQVNGSDITSVAANNASFLSSLCMSSSELSNFTGLTGTFIDATKVSGVLNSNWGKSLSSGYKNNGKDIPFATKSSCPYPKRSTVSSDSVNTDNNPLANWGNSVYGPGTYKISYEDGYICVAGEQKKCTDTPIVFIDLCAGGGGGGGGNDGGAIGGGGGGGGGASAFLAVDLSHESGYYLNIAVGQGGGYGSSSHTSGGADGGRSLIYIGGTYQKDAVILYGGKGGSGAKPLDDVGGGNGGQCSGTLWNSSSSSYSTGYGIIAIKGYNGKGGGNSAESKGETGNGGSSFKPDQNSDIIPNFDIFSNFNIGYSSSGTQQSALGCGGSSHVVGASNKDRATGGGGGACALGCSKGYKSWNGNGGWGAAQSADGGNTGASSGGNGILILHY